MSDIDPSVVGALIAARGNAYAPYSRHPVGAMVESAPPRAMLAGLVKRLAPHFERIELRE